MHHYKLNLPFDPLVKNYKFPQTSTDARVIHPQPLRILSDECREWLTKMKLTCYPCMFEHPAGCPPGVLIHSDATPDIPRYFAVNWTFGCNNWAMEWFKPSVPPTVVDGFGTQFVRYIDDPAPVLLDSTNYSGPILVDILTPHSATQYTGETRYCLSLRFKEQFPWPQAVEYFSEYII